MSGFENLPPPFGRYEPVSELGQGAMGRVYAATDPLIERLVAIKTIRADLLAPGERQEFLERFRAEVRAAGRAAHPAIVAIHDFADDGENPYIVMEFVRGETLAAALRGPDRAARLPRLVASMLEVLEGLSAAHAVGVIHRDIKPGNIMLTASGRAKITDFGIARLGASAMTVAGGIIGTPGYMAPEQALGREVDHRADIFSTAAVLYEILLGRAPFAAPSMAETLLRLTAPEPADIGGLSGTAAGDVLSRGLAKDPALRFATAAEFHAALRATLAGRAAPPPQEPPTRVLPRAAGVIAPGLVAPALIERLREDLADRIGPIAQTLVRRAAAASSSPQELVRACVAMLETAEERRDFLSRHSDAAGTGRAEALVAAGVRDPAAEADRNPAAKAARSPAAEAARSPAAEAVRNPAAEATRSRAAEAVRSPAAEAARSPAAGPAKVLPSANTPSGFTLAEPAREAAVAAMAFLVGPIARILVQKAATGAADAAGFIDTLCGHAAVDERPALRRALSALF